MSTTPSFYDRFWDPELRAFYDVQPGIGDVAWTPEGLSYQIRRGRDGPPTEGDDLVIDSLGRPCSPTKNVVLRFDGDSWTFEAFVTYDFSSGNNGRHAYLWLAFGDPEDRYRQSVVMHRGADYDRDLVPRSHTFGIDLFDGGREAPLWQDPSPGSNYAIRVVRADAQISVFLQRQTGDFIAVGSHRFASLPLQQSVVLNSSSFAGGASFILKRLSIAGAYPSQPPHRDSIERHGTPTVQTEVSWSELAEFIKRGHDVALEFCRVTGKVDFSSIAASLEGDLQFIDCYLDGAITSGAHSQFLGSVVFLGCSLPAIGLSLADFSSLFQAVDCEFRGDTRFIGSKFRRGANFSASHFTSMPFFGSAESGKAVSFYHTTFDEGADLSEIRVAGDLSVSDVWVGEGSMALVRASVSGITRAVATHQRRKQSFGKECNLSRSTLGTLSIGAGDPRNQEQNTGPARWDMPSRVSLRDTTIKLLDLHNVKFAETFDLSSATLDRIQLERAEFVDLVCDWPPEHLKGPITLTYAGTGDQFARQLEPYYSYYSCFISYSSKDQAFMDRLAKDLETARVRVWYAPESLPIGYEIEGNIRKAIAETDKVLVIMSDHSIRSEWVQFEVERAQEEEHRSGRVILFPICLEEAVMAVHEGWSVELRQKRNIGNMLNWQDEKVYRRAFQRLLRDLRTDAPASGQEPGSG